ncbi:MAG: alpha/beta hydrolase [Kastovskya adunca ATA6-11-RM4]|jgi:pimeloyl-ACP methyl ester carboxylesterase|nr:alpha/beta hydrolase [Kastovskya adunca ATA6-11-RM4]
MDLPLRNSRIKLSQGQIFWREIGQGAVIVFLHGSWSESSQWLPVIEQLNQNYHCFAPDLLGFGESEQANTHYSIELEVECLAEYLEALQLDSIYLVGHSLGGWIAASYALKYAEQVRGLILLSPEGVQVEGHKRPKLGGRKSLTYWLLRSLYPLAKLFRLHKPIQRALSRRQQRQPSPIASQLLFKRRPAEITAELCTEHLQTLKIPTLILQGEQDTAFAIAQSQTYGELTPDARLLTIPQIGNDLPAAQPKLVATHIHNFIEETRVFLSPES